VLAGLEAQRRPGIATEETDMNDVQHQVQQAIDQLDAEGLAWLEHAYDQNS
jgi:hypothetical protein